MGCFSLSKEYKIVEIYRAVRAGLCFPMLFLGKGAWVSTHSAPCAIERQESLEPASIWLIHEVNGEKII